MFEIERRGYNQKQVGDFVLKVNKIITELRNKNAELGNQILDLEEEIAELKLRDEEAQILLQKAVENENNSKKLLDLEAKKINDLIDKWTTSLEEIRSKFGVVPEVEKQAKAFQRDLEKTTQKIIDLNLIKEKKSEDKIYHKQLLNKMRDMQALNENVDEKNNKVEPVSNVKGDKDNYFSLVNKYLGEIDTSLPEINIKDVKTSEIKEEIEQNYPIPNESGFDLREAVNPKESLEDIMSGFDFYNPEENLKKKRKIK